MVLGVLRTLVSVLIVLGVLRDLVNVFDSAESVERPWAGSVDGTGSVFCFSLLFSVV